MAAGLDSVLSSMGPSNYPDIAGGIAKETGEYKKNVSSAVSKIEESAKGVEGLGAPPTLTPLPKAPTSQNTDPWKTFGSPAVWLATFGSMFTKQPMINALNAAGGVMKAQAANDEAAYRQQMDLFKVNLDNYWKNADYEMDAYNKAISAKDKAANIRSSEINAYDAMFKNDTGALIHQGQGIDSRLQHQEDLMKQYMKLVPFKQFSEWYDQNKDTASMEEINKRFGDAAMKMSVAEGKGGSLAMLTPEAVGEGAEYLEKTGKMPATARSGDIQKAILNRHAELYPNSKMAENAVKYAGEISGARAVGTQTGKIKLASNILDQSLPSLMEAADKVGLSRSTNINAIYNAAKKRLSDKDFANFSTQLRAVTTDYAQFIGRGSGTVHSDEEALKLLSTDFGITSLQGFEDAVNIEKQNVGRGIDITQGKESPKEPASKSPNGWSIEIVK